MFFNYFELQKSTNYKMMQLRSKKITCVQKTWYVKKLLRLDVTCNSIRIPYDQSDEDLVMC